MEFAELFKQYLEHLFAGKRCEARELVFAAQDRGVPAVKLIKNIVWPAMEQVEKLYAGNHISRIMEHMACRINRMIADQLHLYLAREPKHGRRIVIACGDGETEELGAQITTDIFEADGWSVWFVGAGVPNDEVLQFVGKVRPDILCIYGAKPASVPGIRQLIGIIREINVCPDMQVMVAGGVFGRAEGLSDEVKADLFAKDAASALDAANDHPVRLAKPDVPQPGRRRKRRRVSHSAGAPRHLRATETVAA